MQNRSDRIARIDLIQGVQRVHCGHQRRAGLKRLGRRRTDHAAPK